jgi:hypothetical protein
LRSALVEAATKIRESRQTGQPAVAELDDERRGGVDASSEAMNA